MDKITYSIISKGVLLIKYQAKSIRITGELTFNPPTFYADLKSLDTKMEISDNEKREIIEYIKVDSIKSIGTQIVFD